MTIEQTIEIPANRRIFLDLPPDLPVGAAKVALTVTPESPRKMTPKEAVEYCRGLGKRLGSKASSDSVLEARREDKLLEDAKFRRLYGHGLIEDKK